MSFDYFIDRVAAKVFCLAFLIVSLAGVVAAQPGTSTQQGLISNAKVSEEIQLKMGLVSVDSAVGGCSGALIRQNWVLTAAHCFETDGKMVVAADGVDITLRGTNRSQTRKSVQIISFRPNDVAIVRVQTPFNGNEFANREVYTGPMINMTLRLFGKGINEFSTGGNPSKSDGLFRDGFVNVDDTTSTTYIFNARAGVTAAGGDSGGPSFVKGRGSSAFGATDMIAGVHSTCKTECADGKETFKPIVRTR